MTVNIKRTGEYVLKMSDHIRPFNSWYSHKPFVQHFEINPYKYVKENVQINVVLQGSLDFGIHFISSGPGRAMHV